MLDSKLVDLLASLSETEYLTSKRLADQNETSDRTVQTRIRDLRKELESHGATIESRPRHGYRLVVQDRERYKAWLQTKQARMRQSIPNSVEERFRYMLARFFVERRILETGRSERGALCLHQNPFHRAQAGGVCAGALRSGLAA